MKYTRSGGCVVWITGLSGSGKSTIAELLAKNFFEQHKLPIVLDGDAVREAVNDENCGYDNASRLKNAYRISRFSNLLAAQGRIVIVATMSLFHEIHNWNRSNLPSYFEIFLDVSVETVILRDPKNIYDRIQKGQESNVPGIDLKPQFPLNPDLKIDNNSHAEDLDHLIKNILNKLSC